MIGGAVGGFGVGFIEKTWGNQIPTFPLIGRKGAIALGVYMLKPKSKLIQDIGLAAACLAGYEFATTNKISGPGDEFFVTT